MTSESTDTLILAFTSKTVQSVAHYRHRIFFFFFFFFCQREDIFRHCIGLISDFRQVLEIELNEEFFLFDFYLIKPAPVLGIVDLRYITVPGFGKMRDPSPAGCMLYATIFTVVKIDNFQTKQI